jgi:hypothetical protein
MQTLCTRLRNWGGGSVEPFKFPQKLTLGKVEGVRGVSVRKTVLYCNKNGEMCSEV